MYLLQPKNIVWDEIIQEMKINWECITLMDEQKIVIKDYEFFILATKEYGENNSQISKNSSSL